MCELGLVSSSTPDLPTGGGGMNTIAALRRHHDKLRAVELARARRLLAGGTPAQQVLERLARGLTNKALHAPTQALSEASTAERAKLLFLLHKIYELPNVR